MTLKERHERLLSVAREMAQEYEQLCSTMADRFGCEGCPLNVEDMDGGGCKWYADLYVRMSECGVLEVDE